MDIPIVNRTDKEILIGIEPEGDTLPLAPGRTVAVRSVDGGGALASIELDIEDGLVSISMMCGKEVWSDGVRIR